VWQAISYARCGGVASIVSGMVSVVDACTTDSWVSMSEGFVIRGSGIKTSRAKISPPLVRVPIYLEKRDYI
jgi:hypothetical protein